MEIEKAFQSIEEKISEVSSYCDVTKLQNVLIILKINSGRERIRNEIDKSDFDQRIKKIEELEKKLKELGERLYSPPISYFLYESPENFEVDERKLPKYFIFSSQGGKTSKALIRTIVSNATIEVLSDGKPRDKRDICSEILKRYPSLGKYGRKLGEKVRGILYSLKRKGILTQDDKGKYILDIDKIKYTLE